LEENLNYRAATLMRLWSRRFPSPEIANQYAGNPKKINGGTIGLDDRVAHTNQAMAV